LESVGFNHSEILIYLDLIQAGKASPLDISRRTKLHRSNVYDVLEKLFEKGIVDETIQDSKKYFYPIDPEDLLDYLKQKENELESILPEIEKIHNIPEESRRVTLSEGINSIKNILDHTLDFNLPIQIYGMTNTLPINFDIFLEQFHRKRIKRKIPLRIIYSPYSEKEAIKINRMDYSEAKILATPEPISTTLLCGDKEIIIIWKAPKEVIIIQSEEIKKTHEEYFKYLWESARNPLVV
jgi:sugar-specific transcriptional regulator TrmB